MTWVDQVNALSGQDIRLCYHCHKCTAGCPVVGEMEFGPDRILRLVQLEAKDRLLSSKDIWLCAACEACGARCPNGIDIAKVMDALHVVAAAEGKLSVDPETTKFHRLFLTFLRMMGRMHEASLLGVYKLWAGNLTSDLDSAAKLLLKRKIPLIPHPVKRRDEIRRLFKM